MKIITTEEFAKATKLDKLKMPGLAALLMEVMKINQVNKLFADAQPKQGPEFVDAILEGCGVDIEFDERELKNIPATVSFIAIANHPYGGIEGMVLLKILCMARPDSKLMANFLLKKIPNLSDYFVAVNPFEIIEHSSSISGLKTTMELLANAKVPVVPIYFHGNNGLIFNLLSMIHPSLRSAKLPSELFNKQGHTIKLRIGKPINVEEIPDFPNPNKILNFLRAKTYTQKTKLDSEKKIFNPRNLFKIKK